MPKKERSEPILKLVELLKEVAMDNEYSFEVPVGKGEKFLHRMRVELSRFRTKAKGMGYTAKHFKILHIKTELLAGEKQGMERVTVKKTRSGNNVSDEVHELLKEISL